MGTGRPQRGHRAGTSTSWLALGTRLTWRVRGQPRPGHCVLTVGLRLQDTLWPRAIVSPWQGHHPSTPRHHGPPRPRGTATSPGHLTTTGHLGHHVPTAWPALQVTLPPWVTLLPWHGHHPRLRAPSPRPHPHHCERRGDRSWGTENRWANLLRATSGSTGAGKGTKPGGDSGDSGGGSGGCGGCSGGCGGSVPLQRLSKHQLWQLFALAA